MKKKQEDDGLFYDKEEDLIDEGKTKRFGVIETSIFKYITPLMILIAAIIVGIIVMNIGTLYVYFETNVYLNGLIIFLMFLALGGAFYNNYIMFRTAKFLKKVENVAHQEEINPADVINLHKEMVKKAYLVDTQNMHNVIQGIQTFENLIFTDNDARLIKHKLGYRIRLKKSSVGFLAGILVMLGLLGTFLGLLKTIDSVGAAMGSMSSLTGGDGGVDENAMNDFISGLSAPLQGMGLAFSSSLFGLSGSLLIGFFNHLCGGAQDAFIENVGRWIDDRIPSFKPDAKPGAKGSRAANKDDVQTWFAGFLYMSIKTNKRLSRMTNAMLQNIKDGKRSDVILQQIEKGQGNIINAIEQTGRTIASRSDSMTDEWKKTHELMRKGLTLQAKQANMLQSKLGEMNTAIGEQNFREYAHAMHNDLLRLSGVMQDWKATNENFVREQEKTQQMMAGGHDIESKMERIIVDMELAMSKLDDMNEDALKKILEPDASGDDDAGDEFEDLEDMVSKAEEMAKKDTGL